MLILALLTFFSTQAQDSKELWDELEVAMNQQPADFLELQAFQKQIQSDSKTRFNRYKKKNGFVEQAVSTGMAGIKKELTPVKKARLKKSFKAPRSRSR
jgi:hypothetical protein